MLVHGVMSKSGYHREQLSEGEGRKTGGEFESSSQLLYASLWGGRMWPQMSSAAHQSHSQAPHVYWNNSERTSIQQCCIHKLLKQFEKGILSFATISTESIAKIEVCKYASFSHVRHTIDFIRWDWQMCTSQVGAVWWSKLTVAYICHRAYWFQVRALIRDDSRVYTITEYVTWTFHDRQLCKVI